ncbi:MAG TPA: archease [Geobacteraceae bacterium]
MPYCYLTDIAIADVAFEAWGDTREEMFTAAAHAMMTVMVENPLTVRFQRIVAIRLEHEQLDLLLFNFLQELLFHKDAQRLLLLVDNLQIEERDGLFTLNARTCGETIDPSRHQLSVDVKAVTLHLFQVREIAGVWRATVVVDV